MIERFTSSHSGVSVEVRTNLGFTEVEKKRALEAVHFAVMETPEVLDAVTFFDFRDTSDKDNCFAGEHILRLRSR